MLCWCKDCDGVFKLSEEYLKNNEKCPKVGCWGELVEVDELMLPIIRILNRKGYETQYCCSGHVNDSSVMAYICFQAGANPLGDGLTVRQMIEQLGEEQTRRVLRGCWEESMELYNQIKGTLPRPWVMELPGAYYWGPQETLGEQMQKDQAQGVYKVPRYYMNILGEEDEGFETYWEEIQRVLDLYMEGRGEEAESAEMGDQGDMMLDFRICIRPRLESWNDLEDRWILIRDFDRLPELCEPLAEKWGYLPDKKFQFTMEKLLEASKQRRLSPFEQEMAEACQERNHWLAGEPGEAGKIQAVGEYLELKHLGALERYVLTAEPTFVGSFLLDWVVPQYMSPDSMSRCPERDPKEFMDLVKPLEVTSPGGLIEQVLDLEREDVRAVSGIAVELREFFEKLIAWWGPLQLTENQAEKVEDPDYILEIFGFKRSVELTEDEKEYRDYRKLVKADAQLMQWAVKLEDWHE